MPSTCTAVGDYWNIATQELTLAEDWNGMLWLSQWTPNPGPNQDNSLNGVSCTSASACTAVGTNGLNFPLAPFGETWNGSQWSTETIPTPVGANDTELLGTSCTAAAACTAVGDSYNPTTEQTATLIERYS